MDEQLGAEIEDYDNLKLELQRIYEAKGKRAIFRSKVRWVEQGEKPTKYFFNLEKRNFNRKVNYGHKTRRRDNERNQILLCSLCHFYSTSALVKCYKNDTRFLSEKT